MDLKLLEAKLERHKIAFSRNEDEIVIGKSKMDFITLIGLVLFPIIAAIAIALFFLEDLISGQGSIGKIVGGIILLFSIGGFNYKRLVAKKRKQ